MKCPICSNEYETHRSVLNHLLQKHKESNYTAQRYYDEYIRTSDKEGLCKLCGKPTNFHSIGKGYREFCSHKCCNTYTNNREDVREKIKDTLEERYGDRNYVNVEGVKQTKLERYGYECFPKDMKKLTEEEQRERVQKILNTKEERYGDKCYCNTEQIAETKLERYGDKNYNNANQISDTWQNKNELDLKEIINKRYLARKKKIEMRKFENIWTKTD
jgi:endogenous inhibitor of DNA gyrase (YacG/DUF329 family)